MASDFDLNKAALATTIEDQAASVEEINTWRLALSGRPHHDLAGFSGADVSLCSFMVRRRDGPPGPGMPLLASGDAGLISDSDLRGRLAAFYGWLDLGFEDHDNEMDVLMALTEFSKVELGPMTDPVIASFTRDSSPPALRHNAGAGPLGTPRPLRDWSA